MPGRRRAGGFGGTGSGLGTLQQSYNAAASSAAEGIVLDATRLGLIISDTAAGVGGSLLSVRANNGTRYFDLNATTTQSLESGVVDGATAVGYVLDTINTLSTSGYRLASFRNGGTKVLEVAGTGAIASLFFGSNGNVELRNTIASSELDIFIGGTARVYADGSRFAPFNDLSGHALGGATFRWNGIFGTSLSSGASQALTITGSASSTWSLSAGSLTLSTTGAGNALTITAGDASSWTTAAGILTISGAGGMTIGAGGQQNQVRGGIQVNNRVTVNDAPYTANAYDCIIEYTALTANRTVTIPNAAAGNLGQIYIIKMGLAGGSVNKISTTTVGGVQLIDGAATYTPATGNSWSCYCLYSTGANWMVWAEKGSLT